MAVKKIDLPLFFASVRATVFKGSISQSQVDGITRLLACWEKYGDGLSAVADEMLSYGLATSWWETGHRMQPVREAYASSTAQAQQRLEKAWSAGRMKWVKTPYWRDGWFGRGDVQLTHEANYRGAIRDAVLKIFGVDIHANPDAVLDPEVSAFILFEGIRAGVTLKADFTAYALEDFIRPGHVDFENARKTVNPGDKDSYEPIADCATHFLTAIKLARFEPAAPLPTEAFPDSLYDGTVRPAVKAVQDRLRALLYPEVGNADGRWGSKTAGAILAFRNDKGLPLIAKIDAALLSALATAKPRDIAPERANATVETIKTAPAVKAAIKVEQVGKWGGIAGTVIGVATGGLNLENLSADDLAGLPAKLRTVNEIGTILVPMLPYIGVAVAGYFVYRWGRKVVAEHLKGYQEGRHV